MWSLAIGGRWAPSGGGAERAGFEPAMEVSPHTRLAGECLQPLGHLSGQASQSRASASFRRAREKAHMLPPADPAAPLRYNVPAAPGGVAERLNAPVLKTGDGRPPSAGSN